MVTTLKKWSMGHPDTLEVLVIKSNGQHLEAKWEGDWVVKSIMNLVAKQLKPHFLHVDHNLG